VMGYCYAMIWRHAREVAQRVHNHNAYQLLTRRQRQRQKGASVFVCDRPPSVAVIPSNACINAQETARAEPLLSANGNGQLLPTDDDVHRSTRVQLSDRHGHSDCKMDSSAAEKLLSVEDEHVSVPVDYQRMPITVSDNVTASTTVPSSSLNTVTCSSCSNSADHQNVEEDIDNEQKDVETCVNQRLISSPGSHQSPTSLAPAYTVRANHLPQLTTNTRNATNHAAEQETCALDDRVTNGSSVQHVADEPEHLQPTDTIETVEHDSVTVFVIPPATTPSSTAAVLRESPADATGKTRPSEDADVRLRVGQTQTRHDLRVSPCHGRSPDHDINDRSLPASSPTCQRHRSHSLHMILAVFFAFVLTYLPYTVTNLADLQGRLDRNVYMMTSLAFWSGSCVNPLIYGIMNVHFRRAYVTIVVNCWRHLVFRCHSR